LDADTWLKGWHVILGANGSGKSSLIRAVALVLVGISQSDAARINKSLWVRSGQDRAQFNLQITRVIFRDGAGVDIPVLELSDGYRSVLSLTFELIRQMAACFPSHELFDETGTKIVIPGVVLIDVVHVHLHPNWQRAIGPWLCRLFPQVQFIVTTHSTFVCQEATSIWRLPDPGTEDEFKRVTGEELTRLKLGDATLALETHAFGLEQNRSDRANELLDELAMFNRKFKQSQLDDKGIAQRTKLQELLRPVLPG